MALKVMQFLITQRLFDEGERFFSAVIIKKLTVVLIMKLPAVGWSLHSVKHSIIPAYQGNS